MKIYGILLKHDAHNLKWNRFFNKHDTKGGNIHLDLCIEQLNKIVTTMWRYLWGPISASLQLPELQIQLMNTVDGTDP